MVMVVAVLVPFILSVFVGRSTTLYHSHYIAVVCCLLLPLTGIGYMPFTTTIVPAATVIPTDTLNLPPSCTIMAGWVYYPHPHTGLVPFFGLAAHPA